MNNIGGLYKDMGRYAEAEPLYRRALDGREAALGPAHPSTLISVGNLGILLRDMGRHAEGEPLLRRAHQVHCGVPHRAIMIASPHPTPRT